VGSGWVVSVCPELGAIDSGGVGAGGASSVIASFGGVGSGGGGASGAVIWPKIKHSKPLSRADIPRLIKVLDCYGGWSCIRRGSPQQGLDESFLSSAPSRVNVVL
jgi:hypothetical protein